MKGICKRIKKVLLWTAGIFIALLPFMIAVFPLHIMMGAVYLFKPFLPLFQESLSITWNIQNKEWRNKKIWLAQKSPDLPENSVHYKKLTVGKTRKVKLHDSDCVLVMEKSKPDNIGVYIPGFFGLNWREDLDEYEKADSYEIIVYTKPVVTECEVYFEVSPVIEGVPYKIIYYDAEDFNYKEIQNSGGKFYKADAVLSRGWTYRSKSRDDVKLFFTVKSAIPENGDYEIDLTYERQEEFRQKVHIYNADNPDKPVIKTIGMELNGTESLECRFLKSDGTPVANEELRLYFVSEEIQYAEIYTVTDNDGWLRLENLPEGKVYPDW